VIYGDSAYIVAVDEFLKARHSGVGLTAREILENKTLSSCREVIEWDYGDVGVMWSYVDYKKALKMRTTNVANTYLTAMLLRNAHVTMNGCTTSSYFSIIPPTFEDWISQGPKDI
jgi:hypothetical protein